MFAGFHRKRLVALGLTLLLCGVAFAGSPVAAQTDPQAILNALRSGVQIPGSTGPQSQTVPLSPTVTSTTQTLQPTTSQSAPLSRLEQLYTERAGRSLTQFGYDQFGVGQSVPVTQIGGIQDAYVLGIGDQLLVTLRGHDNASYQAPVDRNGQVVLPNIEPVGAAGRSFGEVRDELSRRIAAAMIGTKAFISVGSVRQISVVVSGEVQSPGVRTLSGLNTALDAILLSGGIRKTGSLRSVTVIRGSRRFTIDLYSIIARGRSGAVGALAEGDRIYVPPIQATVAIAGLVKRAGIYELATGATGIDVNSLVTMAGGAEIAGRKRLTKLEIGTDGRGHLIGLGTGGTIRSGEVLFVDQDRDITVGRVTLDGAVNTPGLRALGSSSTMSQILRDPDDLNSNAYTLFSIIVHRDRGSNVRGLRAFSIKRVFDGTDNPHLDSNDHIYVLSRGEMQKLASATAVSTANPQVSDPNGAPNVKPGNVSALENSANSAMGLLGAAPASATSTAQTVLTTQSGAVFQTNSAGQQPDSVDPNASHATVSIDESVPKPAAESIDELAQRLEVDQAQLVRFAHDYLVLVNGEVQSEGPYLVYTGSSLKDLIGSAGGFQLQADLSAVEVTSTKINSLNGTAETTRSTYRSGSDEFASVSLKPFDSVRIRPVFSDRDAGQITVAGQVKFPGTFDITRGERLSSVLLRAGGLTNEGYPYGAVFTRESAKAREQEGNLRAAQALQDQLASVASDPTVPATSLAYLSSLAQSMRSAPTLGRLTITADPVVLATHPELDMLLETGDKIYFPKRPSSVAVSGEVLNAGAFQYRDGLSTDDYLRLAGGANSEADTSSVFVLLPDGSAQPQGGSWWRFGANRKIPPGSTIIVPRDPRPFVLSQFLTLALDAVAKIAVTAASLAVVTR